MWCTYLNITYIITYNRFIIILIVCGNIGVELIVDASGFDTDSSMWRTSKLSYKLKNALFAYICTFLTLWRKIDFKEWMPRILP